MGRRLRRLVGAFKDKASIGKALALSNLDLLPIRLAIVEATSHDPSPPSHRHISTILATAGHSSRFVASSSFSSLLDRLNQTRSWAVALKCLIVVHRIAQQGPFILQDQLGFYPSAGGRSPLNLANFRDPSSPEGWAVSSWVRWYARFLESVLQASRVLGYFFNSGRLDVGDLEDDVAAMTNMGLLKELEALVGVMEEICQPEFQESGWNPVVAEASRLVVADLHLLQEELLLRVREVEERIPALSFPELADFVLAVKRLGAALEGPAVASRGKATGRLRDSVNRFLHAAPVPSLLGGGANHRLKFSESARFGSGRLVSPEIRFLSGRLEFLPV